MRRAAAIFAAVYLVPMSVNSARAAVLYDSSTGTVATSLNTRPANPPTGTSVVGRGDDYSTTSPSLNLTGLTFYGSVGSTTTIVTANFFNAAGTKLASVATPAGTFDSTAGAKTFDASYFGANGLTVPGTGYVVFSVTSSDTSRPSFNLQYQTTDATTGSNNLSSFAQLDGAGNLTTGPFFNNGANVAQFTLIGTTVPEPASLSLLAPLAMAIRRRRARD